MSRCDDNDHSSSQFFAHRSLSRPEGQSAWALVPVHCLAGTSHRAKECVKVHLPIVPLRMKWACLCCLTDGVIHSRSRVFLRKLRATWNEVCLLMLLREMVLYMCLTHATECRWSCVVDRHLSLAVCSQPTAMLCFFCFGCDYQCQTVCGLKKISADAVFAHVGHSLPPT